MVDENIENRILTAIDNVFCKGHKSKFSASYQKSVVRETEIIKEYLGITEDRQAIFWAQIFSMCIQSNSSIDLEVFSNYLNTTILRVLTFQHDFDELCRRKLINRQKSSRRRRGGESLPFLNIGIPVDLIYSVVNNEPLPTRKSDLTIYEILDEVYSCYYRLDEGYMDSSEFYTEMDGLINSSRNPTLRQIKNYKLSSIDLSILMILMQQTVQGNQSLEWIPLLKMFSNRENHIKLRKEWQSGKSKLQQLGLVRFQEDSEFRSDRAISLSEKGMDLFGSDKDLFIEVVSPKTKDLILSTNIVEQKLFFNEREKGELDFLSNLLQPNNYNEVVNRLKTYNMKGNFTILFSGHPGTGKTESVYQIARSTGRDIKMVDTSKTKSKWFGESEKLIAGIFSSYRRLAESSTLTPILLFNEADGVMGSRQTGEDSSVRQTENAIQTCLLQSMEDFEGILIATTNIQMHLREFERRFLYKISFDKPDLGGKTTTNIQSLPI